MTNKTARGERAQYVKVLLDGRGDGEVQGARNLRRRKMEASCAFA